MFSNRNYLCLQSGILTHLHLLEYFLFAIWDIMKGIKSIEFFQIYYQNLLDMDSYVMKLDNKEVCVNCI